jgi:hypothetical protein
MKNIVEQLDSIKQLKASGAISNDEYLEMLSILYRNDSEPYSDKSIEQEDKNLTPNLDINIKKIENQKNVYLGLFVLSLIILFIFLLINSLNKSDRNNDQYYVRQIEKLDKINQNQTATIDELTSKITEIGQIKPFLIKKIEIVNDIYEGGDFTKRRYGHKVNNISTFQFQELEYISAKITYLGIENIDKKYFIRIIGPNGIEFNPDITEGKYTIKENNWFEIGNNSTITSGWGNEGGGSYVRGKYRFEIWLEGQNEPEKVAFFKVI